MRARFVQFKDYVGGGGLGPLLIRATAGSGTVQIIGMLVTFLVGIQLARGLGVEGYGYYGTAMAVISLASVPGEYGIPKLVTRQVAAATAKEDWGRLNAVLHWADRTGLLIGIGVALAVAVVAIQFVTDTSPVLKTLLWGLPIVPLVALARVRGAALQGLHHVVRGQIPFLLLRPAAFALLLLLLFNLDTGAAAPEAMALNAVTAALAILLGQLWLKRRLPAAVHEHHGSADRSWLPSALSMALADGMRLGHVHVATLLLGLLASASAVGLFRIAASTIVLVGLPITTMNWVVAPLLSKLHAEGDLERLRLLCMHSARAVTLAAVLLALPFFIFGRQLLGLIFGSDFGAASTALAILAAGQILTAAFGLNAGLLTMTGHEHRVTRAMFWSLLVGALLTVVLVPTWQESGAALATVGAFASWNILTWVDARRLLGIDTTIIGMPLTARRGAD